MGGVIINGNLCQGHRRAAPRSVQAHLDGAHLTTSPSEGLTNETVGERSDGKAWTLRWTRMSRERGGDGVGVSQLSAP